MWGTGKAKAKGKREKGSKWSIVARTDGMGEETSDQWSSETTTFHVGGEQS